MANPNDDVERENRPAILKREKILFQDILIIIKL